MTTHRERNAEVVSSSASSGVVRVTVRLSGKLIPPLSPASLFNPDSDFDSATIELHRLIALETDLATFESFGIRARLPNVGEILIFQSWWTPDQLELARDADRTWTERRFEAGPALLVHAEDDQSVLARATEQTLSDDAKLLPRGWDHEHCALCWAKIAEARVKRRHTSAMTIGCASSATAPTSSVGSGSESATRCRAAQLRLEADADLASLDPRCLRADPKSYVAC